MFLRVRVQHFDESAFGRLTRHHDRSVFRPLEQGLAGVHPQLRLGLLLVVAVDAVRLEDGHGPRCVCIGFGVGQRMERQHNQEYESGSEHHRHCNKLAWPQKVPSSPTMGWWALQKRLWIQAPTDKCGDISWRHQARSPFENRTVVVSLATRICGFTRQGRTIDLHVGVFKCPGDPIRAKKLLIFRDNRHSTLNGDIPIEGFSIHDDRSFPFCSNSYIFSYPKFLCRRIYTAIKQSRQRPSEPNGLNQQLRATPWVWSGRTMQAEDLPHNPSFGQRLLFGQGGAWQMRHLVSDRNTPLRSATGASRSVWPCPAGYSRGYSGCHP